MGKIHDMLKENGYEGHQLEVYLVRILFCMFADSTSIFEKYQFYEYIANSKEDGSDLAMRIQALFEVLNTPENKRMKSLTDELANFRYINGKLFEEKLSIADFTGEMRMMLMECCILDWAKISPAIFGSMFQSIMNTEERRNLGAHYTSEENILKVIRPLFLDDLWQEFENNKRNKKKLKQLQNKISNLKFLDPACGCGNFLVITYREIRLLELEILKILNGTSILNDDLVSTNKVNIITLNIDYICKVNVDQFYGIEYKEFPAQIAKVAMWLIDHQMNMLLSEEFGDYLVRLPLRASANIVYGNALEIDWNTVVKKSELSFIIGNPPFIGARLMSDLQKKEMLNIFKGNKKVGNLDYVCAWYKIASEYIQNTNIEVAFVSTNSVTQGEQVGILWRVLINKYNININFAHRTFKWSNEASKNAQVYCVIIGFSTLNKDKKYIFDYLNVNEKPHKICVKRINPYLIDAPNIFIESRKTSLNNNTEMCFGNMANDGGNLILSEEEKENIIKKYPQAGKFIKNFIGADEFINNKKRYCIWLKGVSPKEFIKIKDITDRIERVREYRITSKRKATNRLADYPTLFGEIRQTESNYLLIPRVSSEKRPYIPIGFMSREDIASDATIIMPNATLYEFGILTSRMHMVWTRYVCGRLKSDYRYSKDIVFNNFPFPNVDDKSKYNIEKCAKNILKVREMYNGESLANLYNPLTMPAELVKAHKKLDDAVELAYGKKFTSDEKRVMFLFELYQNSLKISSV